MDIALLTDAASPQLDADNQILLAELGTYGIWVKPAVWNNAAVDWMRPRLVIIRSCPDYKTNAAEFLAWAQQVAEKTSLWNPLDAIKWNINPLHLEQLAQAGLEVAQDAQTLAGVKRALIFIGGEFTHAVEITGAVANELEAARLIAPEQTELDLAARTYEQVKRLAKTQGLLFARFDMVSSPENRPQLAEVELVAPVLFLTLQTRAAEKLAEEIYRLWTELQRRR